MRIMMIVFWAGAVVILAGCRTHIHNQRLNNFKDTQAHDHNSTFAGVNLRIHPTTLPTERLPDADGVFVGIAISGGGSRSANFAAGCLLELDDMKLLPQVDYISSVSGGSLTAAYYCVTPNCRWNREDVETRLSYKFQSDALRELESPATLFRLAGTFTRTELIIDALQRKLFTKDGNDKGPILTFNDLRPDRPRLLMNATNLQTGERFIFCNETFDKLNSQLGPFPIANGVAASAAFPVALQPVTLHDYSTAESLKQYVHLVDGGIYDNLGIRTLIDVYRKHKETSKTIYPRGAVIIVIDAGTRVDVNLSGKESLSFVEAMKSNFDLASTALLDRARDATFAEMLVKFSDKCTTQTKMNGALNELMQQGVTTVDDQYQTKVRIIHLALTDVSRLQHLPFPSFGNTIATIPTHFDVSETDARNLYQAAALIVRDRLAKAHDCNFPVCVKLPPPESFVFP